MSDEIDKKNIIIEKIKSLVCIRKIPKNHLFSTNLFQKIEKLMRIPSNWFNSEYTLNISEVTEIQEKFIEHYQKVPNLIYVDENNSNFQKYLIIGDIHGDLVSLFRILTPFFQKKIDGVILLGDYVDRGKYSFQTLMFLILSRLIWPENIILLRGNHEDIKLNQSFGFFNELMNLYPMDFIPLSEILTKIYQNLSLAVITPMKTLCVHAGIPIEPYTLEDFQDIIKPHNTIENQSKYFSIFMQIRWNDPIKRITDKTGNRSYHGYFYYSKSHLKIFLKTNKINRLIKSHESKRGGMDTMFKNKILHIYSSQASQHVKIPHIILESLESKENYKFLNIDEIDAYFSC